MRISILLFSASVGLLLLATGSPAVASPPGKVIGRYQAFHPSHGNSLRPRNRMPIRRPPIQPVHWKKVKLPHGLGKVGHLPKKLPHGLGKAHIRKHFPHGLPKIGKLPKKLPNNQGSTADIPLRFPHGLGNTGNIPRRFVPEWYQ